MNKIKSSHGKNICGEKFCHGDLCIGKVKPLPNKQGSPNHGINAKSVDKIKSLLKLELSKSTTDGDGTTAWRLPNGEKHREGGPAVEFADGTKLWYKNGKCHREDGPAIEMGNGDKKWFKDGELHREDGPAVEDKNGDKTWFLNGVRHREDGPAYEGKGGKIWYNNGKIHREDGPAFEDADGTKRWCINDRCHREDGPAEELADGSFRYYLDGHKISEAEFKAKTKK